MMKPLRHFNRKLLLIVLFSTFSLCVARAQAGTTDLLDSVDFQHRFDSLIQRVDGFVKTNHDWTVKYFYYWPEGGDFVRERFGLMGVNNDKVVEIYQTNRVVVGSPFGKPLLADTNVEVTANFRCEREILRSSRQLIAKDGRGAGKFYIQPTLVNGRKYYPKNYLCLFLLYQGDRLVLGCAKYGRYPLAKSIPSLVAKKQLNTLFNWAFFFDANVDGARPRIRGELHLEE